LENFEDSKDKVNNLERGLHKASAQYLSTQRGIPSEPSEYSGLTRSRLTSNELSFKVGLNIKFDLGTV